MLLWRESRRISLVSLFFRVPCSLVSSFSWIELMNWMPALILDLERIDDLDAWSHPLFGAT